MNRRKSLHPSLNGFIFGLVLILLTSGNARAQGSDRLKVAVTQADMVPIVRILSGNSVDIQYVNDVDEGNIPINVTVCDLIVYSYPDAYEHERILLEGLPDITSVGWPDYERHDAVLIDFPGYDLNPYGFWHMEENAAAIANAVAEALMVKGLDPVMVTDRLANFHSELNSVKSSGQSLFTAIGRERSQWAVVTPETAYILRNIGLGVDTVLYNQEAGFPTGPELADIESRLRSHQLTGIVCPMSLRTEMEGEFAEEIANLTHAELCYVSTGGANGPFTLFSQAAYNNGILAATAVKNTVPEKRGAPITVHLLYSLVIFGLIMYAVLLNKQLYHTGAPVKGNPKSASKKNKK